MRTAVFCLSLLAAPALMGQSAQQLMPPPALVQPSQPESLTGLTPQLLLTPQAQGGWAQAPSQSWRSPLLTQNRTFAFAVPSPQAPVGKMEPIPTQWPRARFEGIPTRWKNLTVVPAEGAAASAAASGTVLLAQPAHK